MIRYRRRTEYKIAEIKYKIRKTIDLNCGRRKKKNNNTNTRSGFRGRRDLILYSYTDKLIQKTGYDPEIEIKCPDNSDNSSDTNNYILKLFFFRFYSVY